MSWQAVEWVLKHSTTKGAARLVMIAIAEQSRNEEPYFDAWEAWPGIKRLTHYSGIAHERTTSAVIARMVEDGVLERVVNGADQSPIRADRRPNLYRIPLSHGMNCGYTPCYWCEDYGVNSHAPRGVSPMHDGVNSQYATGCDGNTSEPSLEPCLEPPEEPSLAEIEKRRAAIARDYYDRFEHLGLNIVVHKLEFAGMDTQEAIDRVKAMSGEEEIRVAV